MAWSGVCCVAVAAPDATLPRPEIFFRNSDVSDVRLSPSGEWLAMAVGGEKGRRALAVVDAGLEKAPTIIASFADADIRSFRWVGDDRLVFNLIDQQSGGGEQSFGPGLYSVHRDGSETRLLIKTRREFLRNPLPTRRETLEANHALLEVPRDGSHEVIISEIVYDLAFDVREVNPLRLDVDTGRTRSIAVGSPAYSRQWLFDPAGEPRAIIAEHEGVDTIYWRAPGQEAWAAIASGPAEHIPFTPAFADRNGNLYVLAETGPDAVRALKRFDFASGKPQDPPLTRSPGFDFRGAFLLDSGGALRGLRLVTDAETTVWFDPKMKAIQQSVDAHLRGHTNSVYTCSLCAETKAVLVHSWSDQDPGAYWIYHPEQDSWQLVGRARRDVDPARMATLDLYRIKARDGLDLPVWLTTPSKSAPAASAGGRPAVVLVHGGPWLRGTQWNWNPEAQFLASRGYVVIEPEYRGSSGYGEAHFEAGWKQWGGRMQDDVADAVRWAAGKGLVDARRVCIAGGSYGGYAALMGLSLYPDLYRCGVAWAAVTDPRLLYAEGWESDVSAEQRGYGLPVLLGDLKKDAELLRAAAPTEHAADIRAPLLLAFGRRDRRVPIEHGTSMRDALRKQGRDPEWIVYEDEGHGWLKVDNRIDFWSRVERFLDRNLAAAGPR